jgi:CPA1 family monovalent cation:H+ antiporter
MHEHPILLQLAEKWECKINDEAELKLSEKSKAIYSELLNLQRKWLLQKNTQELLLNEDIIRRHLHIIDIEEEKLKYM